MGIKRLEYRHVCHGMRNDPSVLNYALEEAIEVFKKRERGHGEFKFSYNEDHPLTIKDLKEIGDYVKKIWTDEEIYIVTDEGFGNES